MKTILMLIGFAVLLISCESDNKVLTEPPFVGEGGASNMVAPASFGFQDALDFISATDSLSKFKNIYGTNINYLGNGSNWEYKFVSGDFEKIYLVTYELGNDWIAVGMDTTENNQVGGSIITKNWIDSDLALEIAEKNGGSQFRTENADCKISVSLSEAVVPNSYPVWAVTYSSIANLTFRINATNGGIIPNY